MEKQRREKVSVGIICQHHGNLDPLVIPVNYLFCFPPLLTKGLSHALVHVDSVCVLHKLPHYFSLLILYHKYLLRLGHATDHHQTNLQYKRKEGEMGVWWERGDGRGTAFILVFIPSMYKR